MLAWLLLLLVDDVRIHRYWCSLICFYIHPIDIESVAFVSVVLLLLLLPNVGDKAFVVGTNKLLFESSPSSVRVLC